jgi:hypothetical protein
LGPGQDDGSDILSRPSRARQKAWFFSSAAYAGSIHGPWLEDRSGIHATAIMRLEMRGLCSSLFDTAYSSVLASYLPLKTEFPASRDLDLTVSLWL